MEGGGSFNVSLTGKGGGGYNLRLKMPPGGGSNPYRGQICHVSVAIIVTQKERYVLDLINKLLPGLVSLSKNPQEQYKYFAGHLATCNR